MSRKEKGSRLRLLPPKLQLQQRDAITGSYPTVPRFSTDGRTGIYNVQFNDTYSVVFTSSNVYNPAVGFPTGNIWLTNSSSNDLSASIQTKGNIRSSIIEDLPFFTFNHVGQEITPFRDNDQPAVDGKSKNNSFFTTGSSVLEIGEGFSSPLWSKNKIEIDISVAAPCSATLFLSGSAYGAITRPAATTDGKSYEMCFYNFASKTWQGVGTGVPFGFYHSNIVAGEVPFEDRAMYGFSPSIVNLYPTSNAFRTQVTGVFEWQASAGQPFTNLGFPYHPKFHATSSQTLNLSSYINQPFLVEKIVIELSAAYTVFAKPYNTASFYYAGMPSVSLTSITQSTIPAAINNIFILNQRNNNKLSYQERMEYSDLTMPDALLQTSIPTEISLSVNSNPTYVNTVRDIITWGGISSFAANMLTSSNRSGQPSYSYQTIKNQIENPKALMTRECNFSSSIEAHDDLTPLSWHGNVYMELLTKSPVRIDRNENGTTDPSDNVFSFFTTGTDIASPAYMDLKYGGGGRNALGINIPNGRNYITPVAAVQSNGNFKNTFSLNKENILVTNENRYRYNPYLLLPTDNLIIGWQQPLINYTIMNEDSPAVVNRNTTSGSFSEIKFLPGPAKVTLYGSYIKEGKEYNDGLNQLLSSDSIHEIIGD